VSEDSDLDGPIDLFHEYDVLPDIDTPDANMDDMYTDDENSRKMQVQSRDLKLEKEGGNYKIGLHAMRMHHILYHQQIMKTLYLSQEFSMEKNC
jgi:hypothetical protein